MARMEGEGPLRGLRVLDIATIVAGPMAGSLMADFGAEVIKLELPGVGDGLRGFPPFREGKPLWWKVTNRGKFFGCLDLRKPEGKALFLRMVAKSDVVIENFRPGTLERWGLGIDTLWEANPRLVVLRLSGFGQDGPNSGLPGFARIFEAIGGLTGISGSEDLPPMHTGYPIGDPIGGLFGAFAILAALWRVAQDERESGEEIDLSLTEAVFRIIEVLAIEYDQLGEVRRRSGNRNLYSAPSDVYMTSDKRYISLAGSTNRTFANNARAIGRPELIDDPRFATNAVRVENAAELDRIFGGWIAAHTQEEAVSAFRTANGTLAPSLRPAGPSPRYRTRTSARCACRGWCRASGGARARSAGPQRVWLPTMIISIERSSASTTPKSRGTGPKASYEQRAGHRHDRGWRGGVV
jgi:crotonobetainyl-CoA:carnitine CoA-transferase CaiB-like acyl-CoA transferase